jgi:hypothetical protein
VPAEVTRAARRKQKFALWLRIRSQALRQRPWIARFRIVRDPEDHTPYLASTQIWVGRQLGWLISRQDRVAEQLRIERSRIPERTAAPGIVRGLIRAQRGVVFATVGLFVIGVSVDLLLHHFGHDIVKIIPAHRFLRRHLDLPAPGMLSAVLTATTAATGTILGLVLSVSLIVFQATAARYQRSRIVAFLLRERVASAVVKLLTVAFLYSLTLLMLSNVFPGVTLYVSTLVAVGLSGTGVVSLITYRSYALAGYLPTQLFATLSAEVGSQIFRALRKGAGRSVQAHAQQVVTEDVGTLEDLTERVVNEPDFLSLAAGLESMSGPFEAYLQVKRRFGSESPWFPRRAVRLQGSAATNITDHITGQGLMAPTNLEPDRQWFEHRLLRVVRLARDGLTGDAWEPWDALTGLYGRAWQYAWAAQEFEVADLILDDVESLASDPRISAKPDLTQRVAELAWIVVHAAGAGFGLTAADIVGTAPWKNSRYTDELPLLAAQQATELARKAALEIALTGSLQTPKSRMVEELVPRWAELETEHRARYVGRGYQLALTLFESAATQQTPATPIAAEMVLRTIVHALELDVLPELDPKLLRWIDVAFDVADGETFDHLRDTLYTVTRRLAEEARWTENWLLLLAAVQSAVPRDRLRAGSNVQQAFIAALDGVFLVAHSYGWAEYHQEPRAFRTVGTLLQAFMPLEGLITLVGDHMASSLLVPFDTTLKYGQWFQPLRSAAFDLPDEYVQDGGIGYSTIKAHPSDLFRSAGMMGVDGDDAVEHLVKRLKQLREEELGRLVSVLAAWRDRP